MMQEQRDIEYLKNVMKWNECKFVRPVRIWNKTLNEYGSLYLYKNEKEEMIALLPDPGSLSSQMRVKITDQEEINRLIKKDDEMYCVDDEFNSF